MQAQRLITVEYNLIDIISGAITLALAVVLLSLKMPHDRRWQAMRRMLRLLSASYVCIGVSNLITGSAGLSEAGNAEIGVAILLVSFFQALFLTATCLAFVSPRRVSVRWLAVNVMSVCAVCCASVCSLLRWHEALDVVWTADIMLYAAQLVYYCRLFRRSYRACLRAIEENYDEEMSDGLPWIRNCFLGAFAVGLGALLFAVFRCGGTMYLIFTSVYTLYYIYLVVCVINYRVEAGYIVKVVAADDANAASADKPSAATYTPAEPVSAGASDAAERRLAAAIERWVEEKRFILTDQTVEEIAHELGTTHAMLKWYFANRMHTTFRTWRISLRIREAQRLLREESVSVSALHKMVGVADKSNFHKQFRQATGMTPREYAERCACGLSAQE